jgi:hypothetical protein
MDMMSFLKTVPAVVGIAGLLMYLMMRPRAPVSNGELVTLVQRVRNTFLLLGCAALILLSVWLILRPPPPDRDIGPEWGGGGGDGRIARLAAIGGIDTTRAASTKHLG